LPSEEPKEANTQVANTTKDAKDKSKEARTWWVAKLTKDLKEKTREGSIHTMEITKDSRRGGFT